MNISYRCEQCDKPAKPINWWMFIAIIGWLLFFMVLYCWLWFPDLEASSEKNYTNEEIVRAIWIIEGKNKAQYAYGIRSIPYKTITDARRYCLNSVRNNRKRYAQYGYKQYPDYLSFLASRYCPTSGRLSNAEKRLNKFWLRNLKYQLAKQAR